MTSNKLSKRIRALLDYEDNITTMIASARFGGNGECDCSKDVSVFFLKVKLFLKSGGHYFTQALLGNE
jgi:hypothetical protein